MSHVHCDSSASPGGPRVLSQVGSCHGSCPRACVFEHWQELSPTGPFSLKCAGCGTRAALQGDASLWRTGAPEECIAQGQGYTHPFGEWIQCLNTKSPIPMRSSWAVPRMWTCFQCNPSCSQPTFPELSSGKFKGENILFTSLLFYLLPLAFWQNFLN